MKLLLWLTLLLAVFNAGGDSWDVPLYPDDPTAQALAAQSAPHYDQVLFSQALTGTELPILSANLTPINVGDQKAFFVRDLFSGQVVTIEATLQALGPHLAAWVQNGIDQLSQADLQTIVEVFSDTVYDSVRDLWGSERTPGIDGDPRLHVLFIDAPNGGFTAYYARENSYPRSIAPSSNEHEMFVFNTAYIGPPVNFELVQSVLAHEFQHMIRDNVQPNLDNWLDEGLSMLTQSLLFDDYNAASAFLAVPQTQINRWNFGTDRAANYGAAQLLALYVYQRYGIAALQTAAQDPNGRGLDGLDAGIRQAGGPGINAVFADWVVANRVQGDPPYGYSDLPLNLPSATARLEAAALPLSYSGQLSQYAADYFALTGVSGSATLCLNMPESIPLIPIDPASGSHIWYSQRNDETATGLTRSFDLTHVDQATLEYKIWYALEPDWDYGYVFVSEDAGQSWQALAGQTASVQGRYGPAYTGESGGWQIEQISLDSYAGKQIMLRFIALTDDAITLDGMAVDDVRISSIGYETDFEEDDGGWNSSGWVWVENRLPQRAWLQVISSGQNGVGVTRWLAEGSGGWSFELQADTTTVMTLSPFAPLTLTPMLYTLRVLPGSGVSCPPS